MKLRRSHALATIILLALVFLIGLLAGWWFGAYHYPYRTLPRPPLPPHQKAPDCTKSQQHYMGGCLPQKKPSAIQRSADITASTTGPDLSNNDPVLSDGAWAAIAARNSWAIFKVSEGTGFRDAYAAAMGRLARAHGLVVGGYDFLHVCGDDPAQEARNFIAWLNADGLSGANTFPPVADAEYGGSGCDARGWMNTWLGIVVSLTHRQPLIYTGAWWWQPHLGSYWPNPSLSWISGYGVSYPYMPSGRSQLDLWQFADNAWNGATSVDLSTWRDGPARFRSYTSNVTVDPYAIFTNVTYDLGHGVKAAERPIVKGWNDRHCLNPTRRPVCGFLHYRLELLDGRLKEVADRNHPANWSTGHRYRRAKYIEHELTMTMAPWPAP